jgi:hypothetical protein
VAEAVETASCVMIQQGSVIFNFMNVFCLARTESFTFTAFDPSDRRQRHSNQALPDVQKGLGIDRYKERNYNEKK